MRRVRVAAFAVLVVLAAGVFAGAARADDVRIEVFADRNQVAANELIRLTYRISGSLSGEIQPPSPLPLRNLTLAGGPSRSDQMSFVNGVFSRSLSLTYYLRPKGEGAAEVGETVWTIGGKSVKAAPFLVEVGPPRGRGAGSPAMEEEPEDPIAAFFGGRGAPRPGPGIGPGGTGESPREKPFVDLLVTADKTTAVVGEEVTLTVDLVTTADVQGLEWIEPPKFPGAWAEDLERPERPTGRREIVDGRPVVRFTLLKKLVSGLAPGTVTIPPMKVRTNVRATGDSGGDPFGFFSRPQPVEIASKPLVLRILPVPGAKAWSGPVGHFDLTARLDKTSVPAGEAATLKVRLAGPGGLRTATDPPKLSVANAKVYPPTARTEPPRSGRPGSVEWEYVIVPSAPGELTIPPVEIPTYDTVERKVVTKATPPLRLIATGAAAPAAAAHRRLAGAAGSGGDDTPDASRGRRPAFRRRAPRRALRCSTSRRGPSRFRSGFWSPSPAPLSRSRGRGSSSGSGARRGSTSPRQSPPSRARRRSEPPPGSTGPSGRGSADATVSRKEPARPPSSPLSSRDGVSEELRLGAEKLLSDLDFLRFAPQLGDYDAKIAEVREEAGRLLPRLF